MWLHFTKFECQNEGMGGDMSAVKNEEILANFLSDFLIDPPMNMTLVCMRMYVYFSGSDFGDKLTVCSS